MKTNPDSRRVVITGMGVVSSVGLDTAAFWHSLVNGVSGIRTLTKPELAYEKVHVAATVEDFEPLQYFERKEARRLDRYCQFALVAAREAVAQADGLMSAYEPERVGTIIGSGVGGLQTIENEYTKLFQGGMGRVSPLFIPMMISNMAAGHVSMAYGTKGPSYCVTTACASGTHSIGDAFRLIKHGYADACIAGGCEAPLTTIAVAGFANMTALSNQEDPARASIPFDRRRDGFVIGEGAGVLVLENLESAKKRGANIICEIAGYGSTSDAYHITSPDPEGRGAAASMRLAITEAGLTPADVDYINAHGTSTQLNDKYETIAIHSALGAAAEKVAVSSTKSMVGHLLGAAGAVEAIASALAIRDGIIPPTIGLLEADPECDLDYVPNAARHTPVRVALSNSLGFGGHNATLLLRSLED
ncbi:MAG: beta-ketoacyl-ACP synthase II [Ruminococcaceae bacterium]|nr:beta-ketoacyl-ACP synthase II [Oscillospiraceae bacterium]